MSSDLKTSFELEPNPFEKSFAPTMGPTNAPPPMSGGAATESAGAATTIGAKGPSRSNKHNLHIPNISLVNTDHTNGKLPGITPPLYTPGGRRLPPLGLSPPPLQAAETPGLWNSLLSATNNNTDANGNASQQVGANGDHNPTTGMNGSFGANSAYSQFLSSLKKTGLTPNESNLRSGLTPSGTGFPFTTQFPGLSTPGAILTGPITPGLSSLLGLAGNSQNLINTLGAGNTGSTTATSGVVPPPGVGVNGVANNAPPTTLGSTTLPPIPSIPGDQSRDAKPFTAPSTQQLQTVTQKNKDSGSSETNSKNSRGKRKAAATKRDTKKAKTAAAAASTSEKAATSLEGSDVGSDDKDDEGTGEGEGDDDEDDDEEMGTSQKSGKRKRALTEEEKRKNFLERNRVAASKCRQRKKQLIQKMEEELMFYSSGYRELSVQIGQLRDRLVMAKNLLVGHKDCPMLMQTVGGFPQMNNIFQQLNEAILLSARTHIDPSAIPSTVPTTLNNTAMMPPSGLVNGANSTDKTGPTSYAPPIGMTEVKVEGNAGNLVAPKLNEHYGGVVPPTTIQ